ncbi:AAA family ATPase [Verrucosispora sp. WMMC514]|uniref:AAA family ATPase n=1 Tax=Verrucosispora sp. WMMC514 TaxID=3015156 RepID=UPI00248D39AC|nr:AAA family ATPase [Verrucosispora sp. WMMC514]WBB91545.1 zeta toxin family protein [Verrucosispora sp. WMMC514]
MTSDPSRIERNSPGSPTLVIIRGNSGSGKTTTAREVRRRFGRGAALLEQDYLRRTLLREHDSAHIQPVAPSFITTTARTALDLGYHVIVEGILHTERYATVLHQLIDSHPGPVAVFYLNVSFGETVRRHLNRAEPTAVTPDEMRRWYAHRDLLGVAGETVIGETSNFEQTVTTILHASGLTSVTPQTPCPQRCRHCARESGQAAAVTAAAS